MTDELGPEARALLDAARQGLSPDAAAVSRVRARIGAATSGAAAGTAMVAKLGIVALVAGVAAGAWVYARRDATTAMAPRVELASPSEAPVQAAMHEPPAPASADDDLITIETPPAAPPHREKPANDVTRAAAPARSSRDPANPPGGELPARATIASPGGGAGSGAESAHGIDLAREVELLDVAMAALRRGDAAGAQKAVQRHAVETAGHGQLAEDAAAIEIEALCRLHDPSTTAKLEAFDARFPRSAQRSRLGSQCPPSP